MLRISVPCLWVAFGTVCLAGAEPGGLAERLDWEADFVRQLLELPQQDGPARTLVFPRPLGFAPGPDVSLIVTFGVDRAATTNAELWLTPLTGGPSTRLSGESSARISEAVASPDGRYVAYFAQPLIPQGHHPVGKLVIVDLSSGRRSVVAPDAAWPATWLPRGGELLFSRPVGGGYCTFRATSLADEIVVEPIVEAVFESPAVFSPDGQLIAATLGGALVIVDRGTGRRTELRSPIGIFTGGVWSPDSEWLAFSSGLQGIGGTRERHEVFYRGSGRLIALTDRPVEEVVGAPAEGEVIDVGSEAWVPGENQRLLLWVIRREWNGSCLGHLRGSIGQGPVREGKWVMLNLDDGTATEADWLPGPAAGIDLWGPSARYSNDGHFLLVNDGLSFALYRCAPGF